MHVDDLADAAIFVLKNYSDTGPINIGAGDDVSILDLTRHVMSAVGFQRDITHDRTKPNGTPRKLMEGSKLNRMGWSPSISLDVGLQSTIETFRQHVAKP